MCIRDRYRPEKQEITGDFLAQRQETAARERWVKFVSDVESMYCVEKICVNPHDEFSPRAIKSGVIYQASSWETLCQKLFPKGGEHKNRWRVHILCMVKDSVPKTAYFYVTQGSHM